MIRRDPITLVPWLLGLACSVLLVFAWSAYAADDLDRIRTKPALSSINSQCLVPVQCSGESTARQGGFSQFVNQTLQDAPTLRRMRVGDYGLPTTCYDAGPPETGVDWGTEACPFKDIWAERIHGAADSSGSSANADSAINADNLTLNPADCSATQFATAIDRQADLTCAAITDADVPNTITVDLATAATALAANGANCAAASFPLGVDASGAAESCSTSISGNAATATALAADGANCSSGSFPLGVDASGASQSCTAANSIPAANVTVADAASDTTTFPVLAGSATGDLPMLTDPGLTYDASTNKLTAGAMAIGVGTGTSLDLGTIFTTGAATLRAQGGAVPAAHFERSQNSATSFTTRMLNETTSAAPQGSMNVYQFVDSTGTPVIRNSAYAGAVMTARTAGTVTAEWAVGLNNATASTLTERLRVTNAGLTLPASSTITAGAVVMTPPAATGTLATLAGSEALSNKTYAGSTATLTGLVKASSLNVTLSGSEVALPTNYVAILTARTASSTKANIGLVSGGGSGAYSDYSEVSTAGTEIGALRFDGVVGTPGSGARLYPNIATFPNMYFGVSGQDDTFVFVDGAGNVPASLGGSAGATPGLTIRQNLILSGTGSNGYIDIGEYATTTDAAAPSADRARVYVRDNGAGKEQLVVRFATGAVQVLATEP